MARSVTKRILGGCSLRHLETDRTDLSYKVITMMKTSRNRGVEKPITVITRDNIRQLKPHGEMGAEQSVKKSKRTAILSSSEMEQIKAAARFLTPADVQEKSKQIGLTRDEAAKIAQSRKEKMEKYDIQRAKNAKMSDLDKETLEKSNYLLTKAQAQLEEQEDEIKHLNELMLYAKCVTIRDNQVEQKKYIQRQRKEEDLRLDSMMEFERVSELKKLEEREKKRVEELRKGAATIRLQIEERREYALLEQERRDQETKAILKQIADTAEQEKHEKAIKVQAQRTLMQGVTAANIESMELKKKEKEKEEEEDRKVLQYLLEKEKREEENDRQSVLKKVEREKELTRLRAQQEKMADKQAEQDALRAQRAYEAYEREWRRKEKDSAEKQAQLEKEIREERHRQQLAREKAIAEESQKLKEQFFSSLERQKEVEAKIKSEAVKRAEKNHQYALEVQAQIREKEFARKKGREDFFLEGIRLAQERNEKKSKIDAIKERKIQELRQMGVPSKYCNEIDRQIHSNKKSYFSK